MKTLIKFIYLEMLRRVLSDEVIPDNLNFKDWIDNKNEIKEQLVGISIEAGYL